MLLKEIQAGMLTNKVFLRKNKREFALVFRSKNINPDEFVKELLFFFNGEHPYFNGKNGTQMIKMDNGKGGKNFIIKTRNIAFGEILEDEFGQANVKFQFEKPDGSIETKDVDSFEEIFVRTDESLKRVDSIEWLFCVEAKREIR